MNFVRLQDIIRETAKGWGKMNNYSIPVISEF